MKLKNLRKLVFQRRCRRLIRQFGSAKLIRQPNGQHELFGGTDADRTAAYEWSSLFAHEIVFTHFHRDNVPLHSGKVERAGWGALIWKWWPVAESQ